MTDSFCWLVATHLGRYLFQPLKSPQLPHFSLLLTKKNISFSMMFAHRAKHAVLCKHVEAISQICNWSTDVRLAMKIRDNRGIRMEHEHAERHVCPHWNLSIKTNTHRFSIHYSSSVRDLENVHNIRYETWQAATQPSQLILCCAPMW